MAGAEPQHKFGHHSQCGDEEDELQGVKKARAGAGSQS